MNKNNIIWMRRRSLQPLQTLPPPTSKQVNNSSTRYGNFHSPLGKSLNAELADIFFNEQRRKSHIRNIIDSYFEKPAIQQPYSNTLSPLPKNISIRRRTSLMARTRRQELSSTCPQPFVTLSTSEVIELNKSFLSDQQQGLPPIFQATEDPQANSSSCLFDMTLTALLQEAKNQERSRVQQASVLTKRKRKFTLENQIFVLSYVYFGKSKLPSLMIKQYKQPCREIFVREQKIWNMLHGLDVKLMWIPTGPLSSEARPIRNLKSKLMEIAKESVMAEKVYKINLKPYYDELFLNDNQIIKSIVIEVCRQLTSVKGKLINNKINLSNLFEDGGNILINQWGHSSMIQQVKNSSQTINSPVTPILKGFRQWFVTPQYLPPEFLEHVSRDTDYDMWEAPTSIDIWSIGCMLLELLVLVPLWSPLRCHIGNRPGLSRKGIFHSKMRELPEIIEKQKKLCCNIKLQIYRLFEVDTRVNQKVMDAMIKMLQLDPKKRPTPEQVISMLS